MKYTKRQRVYYLSKITNPWEMKQFIHVYLVAILLSQYSYITRYRKFNHNTKENIYQCYIFLLSNKYLFK